MLEISTHTLQPNEQPQQGSFFRDERSIVVGDDAVVVVKGIHRAARVLASLSWVVAIAEVVEIEARQNDTDEYLFWLTPPSSGSPPSLFYDTIHNALHTAHLKQSYAQVYIGSQNLFVPYDERRMTDPQDEEVLRSAPPEPSSDTRVSPLDLLLRLLPIAATPPTAPMHVSLLTDRRLVSFIAGYAHRHDLAYAVRFLTWQQEDQTIEAALFDIVADSEVRPIAPFVLDYFRTLPHTTILIEAIVDAHAYSYEQILEQEPEQRILVEWGYQLPWRASSGQTLLPDQSMLIGIRGNIYRHGSSSGNTALITPLPPRHTMQQITTVSMDSPSLVSIVAHEEEIPQLRLPLALLPSHIPNTPVHALLLDESALARLRRLLRTLPGRLFAGVFIATGPGFALLVGAGKDDTIEGIPLGQPLNRTDVPELLLPRGMQLYPAISPDLLMSALAIAPETLTILLPTMRYDVPMASLHPLGNFLAYEAMTQMQADLPKATLIPEPQLAQRVQELDEKGTEVPRSSSIGGDAGLAQSPYSEVHASASHSPEPSSGLRGIMKKLPGMGGSGGTKSATQGGSKPFEDELRRRAKMLEQTGAYDIAAAFYAYLRDDKRAAACYRQVLDA